MKLVDVTAPAPAPAPDVEPVTYRVEDAARIMGISRTQLFIEIERLRITTIKVGRRRLVSRGAIDRWLADREREAQADPAH